MVMAFNRLFFYATIHSGRSDILDSQIMKSNSKWRIVGQLFRELWPKDFKSRLRLQTSIIGGLSMMLAGKILNVQVPFFFKHLVDNVSTSHTYDFNLLTGAGTILLGYTAARFGSSIFGELKNVVFSRVGQSVQREMAIQSFKHLHELDYEFHVKSNTGALSRSIERGVKGVNFIFTSTMFNVLPTMVEIVMVCSILGWKFGWPYASLGVATIATYVLFTQLVTSWRVKFRKEMNQSENKSANMLLDSLTHHQIVKYFCNEKYEAKQYEQSLLDYEKGARRTATSLSLLNIGQQSIFSLSLGIVMWMTSKGITAGTATIGDLVMVNGLIFQLSIPLNFLGSIVREVISSIVDIEALFKIKTVKPVIDFGSKELVVKSGEIHFDRVYFQYEKNEKMVLNDFSLSIPAKSTVAIVGSSGSGKSTISKLLYKLVSPNQGIIKIDGESIDNFSKDSLRSNLGIVPQDSTLFNRTIAYNIAYGDLSLLDDKMAIKKAAKLAQIDTLVDSLPAGYESRVGERGVMLSGGERQRINIARMFLHPAPIIVLDEATSSIDSRNEKQIMNSIRDYLKDSTVIIIAHRLVTVQNADMIAVMKDGSVAEKGTHEELMEKKGMYWDLWESQKREIVNVKSSASSSNTDNPNNNKINANNNNNNTNNNRKLE